MADDTEKKPDTAAVETKTETKAETATVESPPIVPQLAGDKVETPPAAAASSAKFAFPKFSMPSVALPKLTVTRRMKRRAALAASLAVAACFGASVGAVVSTSRAPETVNVAAIAEREAMLQKTVATLNKEVYALKSSVDATAKSATTQIAKLEGRLDRSNNDQIVTGSIAKPVPQAAIPVPAPRPANVETKPAVLSNWTVRSVRGDLALLEGPQGIYEVMEGDPIPGLGRVEAIARRDGRWMVTTPKGIIMSAARPPQRYYEPYGRY